MSLVWDPGVTETLLERVVFRYSIIIFATTDFSNVGKILMVHLS